MEDLYSFREIREISMKRSRIRWMKKNDPTAYRYWKKYLAPAIGQSVLRSRDATLLFDRSHRSCEGPLDPRIEKAYRVISARIRRYETLVGALITLNFLRQLAQYRHSRLVRYQRQRGV